MVKGIKQLNARGGNRALLASESEEDAKRDARDEKKNANTSKKSAKMEFNMEAPGSFAQIRTFTLCFAAGCSLSPSHIV